MKTLKEQIEVMQACLDGEVIQENSLHEDGWNHSTIKSTDLQFDWETYDYRVLHTTKPKTQSEEIEARWPDHRVELLVRDALGDLEVSNGSYHVHCPSMKGFDGYVYKDTGGYFISDLTTRISNGKRQFPVAVLIER